MRGQEEAGRGRPEREREYTAGSPEHPARSYPARWAMVPPHDQPTSRAATRGREDGDPLLDSGRLMRPLATIERVIERLVERSSARVFRTRIQPLQVQRRIERAMEMERRSHDGRTVVPSRFTVRLHPTDLAALEPTAGALAAQLADAALTFARAHRFALAERPRVSLVANRAVAIGDIVVAARYDDEWLHVSDGGDAGPEDEREPRDPGDRPAAYEHTRVFTIPQPDAPLAVLREHRPDGTEREVVLDGRPLAIGRATDNDLVLQDPRASRHHARLQARRGTLVLSDLGSTNGTRVNGMTVGEVVLGAGDRIQVGDTVLIVDAISGT